MHRAELLSGLACVLVMPAVAVLATPDSPVTDEITPPTTWLQWRGPARDGQCTGPEWPAALTPDRLTRVWRVEDLGDGYSGTIVTAGRVFSFETRNKAEEVIRAFDRASGEELWQTTWPGSMTVPFFAKRNGSWVRSTPICDGTHLYAGGMQDVLVCLDTANGDITWTVDFKEAFSAPNPSFGLVCSPLLIGDAIYVQAGGSFAKLDKRTGEVQWRVLKDGGGMNSAFSSPILATINGVPQILVQTRRELCAIDPDGGEVLWRQPIKADRGMAILTPITYGDSVFTAAYGGRAQLLSVAHDDAGDAYDITKAWENRAQGYMCSPVIINDHAYMLTRSNRFTCIDLATGESSWTSGPTGDSYWSLIAQGDRILALSDTGELRLIRATPEAYEVIDETSVSDDPTWAHIAVAGQEVFIREQNVLAVYRWE